MYIYLHTYTEIHMFILYNTLLHVPEQDLV